MEDNDKNLEQFDVDENETSSKKEKKKGSSLKLYITIIVGIAILCGILGAVYYNHKGGKSKLQENTISKDETSPVLAADIGGTNCRLRIIRISTDPNKAPIEVKKDVLKPWEHKSIEELLQTFLKPLVGTKDYPVFAVLGIPGAVVENTMMPLVNIPHWEKAKGEDIAKKLGIKKVVFLNDFVCNGYGIQANLKEGKDFIVINKEKLKNVNNDEKKFIIGPGTGLGVCYLIKNQGDKYHTIYGSEGSHSDFAPKKELSFGYLKFLKEYYGIENISCEKSCAGPALVPMYQYLRKTFPSLDRDETLGKQIDDCNSKTKPDIINKINPQIIDLGVSGKCPLCKKVLEYFIEILGNISGNMSIYTLPFGGVYIVGGLSAHLEPILKKMDTNIFLQYFLSRGEQNNLLENIPIILVKNSDLGMIGAIECARRMLAGEE